MFFRKARTALHMTLGSLLILSALVTPFVNALGTNLIKNPSLETVNATNTSLPQAWAKDRWGNNTASFAYKTASAADGNRSVRVTLSNYVSGDAKWRFAQTAVKPGVNYTFSDSFKSNVGTKYTAAYVMTTGATQYVDVSAAGAQSAWTRKTFTFTTPANVKSVSIYHLLNKNGWLETDNYSLAETAGVTSPTVAITAPSAGSTVSGTVNVTANTTNTIAVQFKLDGASLGAEDTTSPYSVSWDTTTTANGSHQLSAIARAADGQTATSSVTVTVDNTVNPPAVNLFANPSVEAAGSDPSLPASWSRDKWGSNTTNFSYPVTGYNSSRAVRTDISAYVDGDAKWFPAAVSVTPNTTYSFQDYYRSGSQSNLVAVFTSTSGATTYTALGTVPASSTWRSAAFTFTTKADTANVTVYHLLSRNGWLEQDTVSLQKVAVDSTNPIVNNSLEIANGTRPYAWTSNKWGSNTASFDYVNDAHTGSKAAKVTVSNYVDGDAKWFFDPITTLTPGRQYRWSTWYKTNVEPRAALQFTRADGTVYYPGIPQPFPPASSATTWAHFSETFTVPSDVVSVSAFLYVMQNGWLTIDDQAITPYTPTGFNRPLVSLTFDDGSDSNLTTSLPIMQSHGFHSTQCYETDVLMADPIAGKRNVMTFYKNGDEVCSHSITHPFLTKLNDTQLNSELADSQSYLQNIISAPVTGFATPYGDYDPRVVNRIKQYYSSWHRTVDEGYNSKDNLNRYRLRVQNLTNTTTIAEYRSWLNTAKATNTWLILVYHDVSNTPSPYGSYVTDFRAQMNALEASGIQVKTVAAALAEVSAQ